MNYKQVEVQILHSKAIHEDNGFGVRILLDGQDTSVLELDSNTMLHIGAILLNASKKFINNADKV